MDRKKLLLVDDDSRLVTLLSLTLGSRYVFDQAADGKEGLDQARAMKPDLILLDIAMPGMDGLEVLRLLKSEPATREIPVLMLTGRNDPNDISRAQELGALDYITKPFSPRALLDKVNEVLTVIS